MKPKLLLIAILATTLPYFAQAQVPVISNFSPAAAASNASVVISGSNFSSTPSANIVFFGGVRANVTAATTSSLTVTVPYDATYAPITVTVGGLTGYSMRPFHTTFPAGGTLDANSFAQKIDPETDLHPNGIALADYDGDGYLDIATANNYSINGSPASISILRNTTTSVANISFAPHANIPNGVLTYAIASGDFDGDGKPDIVATSIVDQNISVFRNTSTPGNISFAPKIELATDNNPQSVCVADLDGDGKPDIAVANFLSGTINVFRNARTATNLAFTRYNVMIGGGLQTIIASDLNNDGKPDLAVTNKAVNKFTVVVNTSAPGTFGYNPPQTFNTGAAPHGIAAADLDGDGKQDIAVSHNEAYTISVFRNTGSAGIVGFTAAAEHNAAAMNLGLSISDLNGDGKPDIITSSLNTTVHQNNSVPGSIILAPPVYTAQLSPSPFITVGGDMDRDGKPDLVAALHTSEKISIVRNKSNEPHIVSFNPVTVAAGGTITLQGKRFTGTSTVLIGDVPATSFTVGNDNTITAVVPVTTSGIITVINANGKGSIAGYVYPAPPTITGFTPAATGKDSVVRITGTNFTNANGVQFGGVYALTYTKIDAKTIEAIVGDGASGNVTVTNPYGVANAAGFVFLPMPQIHSFTPMSAATGDTVTVKGKFFTNTLSVKFGDVPAAYFSVLNDSTLKAVVGSSGTERIWVRTNGGLIAANNFTLIAGINSFTPTVAATYDSITITGTNFHLATSVRIGFYNNTVGFRIVDTTTIRAVVGPASISGDVMVGSYSATRAKSGFNFIPFPEVISMNFSRGGTGAVITIRGRYFSFASAVKFGGTAAATFTVLSDTVIRAVVGAGASGPVSVTTPGGSKNGPSFTFTNVPIIYSVAPEKGAVGTPVTITGTNFFAGTTVFFGSIKAQVTSMTASTIVATVPAGTAYEPIRVQNNGLTAESLNPFNVTFAGGGALTPGVVDLKQVYPTGRNPNSIAGADLDGDGKTDLIVANNSSNTLSVYRNTSVPGAASFAAPVTIPSGVRPRSLTTADMDGNGKMDIVFVNTGISTDGGSVVSIILNNSTTGNFSFAARQTLITGFNPWDVVATDFNSDGKNDLFIVNHGQEVLNIYPNNTTGGVLSFLFRIDRSLEFGFQGYAYYTELALGDLDGDGRKDLFFGKSFEDYFLIGINGSFDAFPAVYLAPYNYPGYEQFKHVQIFDMDGDGKNDVLSNGYIMRNNYGITGNLPFTMSWLPTGGILAVSDLDGDGRPDLARVHEGTSRVSLVRNTSAIGAISFAPGLNIASGNNPIDIYAGDLDGDGKPDLANVNFNDHTVSIFVNGSGTGITPVCANGSVILKPGTGGATYQWQVNTGAGFVTISNNGNYAGVTTSELQLNNVPPAFHNYQYRLLTDNVPGMVYTLNVQPNTQPVVTLQDVNGSGTCAAESIEFYATVSNGGTAPVYTWQVNGVNITNTGNTLKRQANHGDVVRVQVKSSDGCLSDSTAWSNSLNVVKLPAPPTPTAVVAGGLGDCAGSVILTYTSANTPAGTTITPREKNANGYTTYGNSAQVYAGTPLTFTLPAGSGTTRKFYFQVVQSYGSCTSESFTDTMHVSMVIPDTPIINHSGNLLAVQNPATGFTYTWQKQNATGLWTDASPAGNGTTYTATTDGNYRLRVKNGNCIRYSNVVNIATTTSVTVVQGAHVGMKLFPNPAVATLRISGLDPAAKWHSVTIQTGEGKTCIEPVRVMGKKELVIDLVKLPAGTYFLVVEGRAKKAILKFVKQ